MQERMKPWECRIGCDSAAPTEAVQGDKPAFAKHLKETGNREQQLGSEPHKSHLLPAGSLPALKSLSSPSPAAALSSPSLRPERPQTLPVSAASSQPRAAVTALSAAGRHCPAQPCPVPGLSGPADPAGLALSSLGVTAVTNTALLCPNQLLIAQGCAVPTQKSSPASTETHCSPPSRALSNSPCLRKIH